MNKRKILLMASLFALSAFAQNEYEDDRMSNIDWSEDSTEVTTIKDIIKQQQKVTTNNATEKHYSDVWGRRSYFNFSYNSETLSPKGSVPTGLGDVKDMNNDWGLSIQFGHNYRLHRNPISNILQFCIDYTFIDLSANHFKTTGQYSSKTKDASTSSKYYFPWNIEKYDFNFGMSLGPSITLAPFTSNENRALHFLKFNLYYHIGYHISMLYAPTEDSADKQDGTNKGMEAISDAVKMQWGHGLTHSIGFNISWKFIGLGYEYRHGSLDYKAVDTSTFGSDKNEFTSSVNRFYIQIRM